MSISIQSRRQRTVNHIEKAGLDEKKNAEANE